jgi:hypothetical protein
MGKLIYSIQGRDTVGVNWGGDILKNNNTRQQEYDNEIGQGVRTEVMFGTLTLSYMLKHNLFIDASVVLRRSDSPAPQYDNNTTLTSLALRWNIPRRLYEF